MYGFYWGENVAFSFLSQQWLTVKHYNRFQHTCISVYLPSFLLNSSRRMFWFDSVQSSSIKCVVGKKFKKNRKKKKLKKLLFRGNNEKFIRRKEKTVTCAHTQQYLLTPATDHCNLLHSFGLNYLTVVSCLLEWSQNQKIVLWMSYV
jgi:acetone carboxylase gamma subunit